MKKISRVVRSLRMWNLLTANYRLSNALFLIILLPAAISAKEENIKFRRLSLEQGLSQSNVNAIVQDNQGFMWFGTQDGLNRYDGYNFKVYRHNPADSASISDNYIWRLLVDSKGTLWVGTYSGGLNRYDPRTDSFTAFRHDPANPASLLTNNINMIYEDRSGTLWVSSWAGGLSRLDSTGRGFIHYRHDPADSSSLIFPNVGAVLEDSFGDLWVGTWNALARMRKENGHWKTYLRYSSDPKDPHCLPNEKIWSLLEDPLNPGYIFIGTYGGGVCVYERNSGQFIRLTLENEPEFLSRCSITSIVADNNGLIWIGTYENGLTVYDPVRTTFSHHRNNPHDPASLGSDEVLCIYQDRSGAVWIGTGNGISIHDQKRKKFIHYSYIPNDFRGLSHNKVRAVWEDSEGGLWVGTKAGGLNYRKSGSKEFIQYRYDPANPYSLSEDRVSCIYQRRNGEIWIGTENNGLNRLDKKTGRFYRYRHEENRPNSLSSNSIMALLEDRAGNMWIGASGGGLVRYDPANDAFIRYAGDPGNPNLPGGSSVWALFQDRDGYLWAGTWGQGVTRFDPENNQFTRYVHDPAVPQSLSNNTVWCITEDFRGNLWMGTWGGGLNLYDRASDRFYHLTEQDGLPNNAVYGILPDSSDNLWISTNWGIARLFWQSANSEGGFNGDPGDLKKHLQIKKYDVSDGLQSNEFNQGAYFRGKSGMMYFGGINGLNAFYPRYIQENPFIPPLVITSFKVFEKPVSAYRAVVTGELLTFPYNENYFSIEYAALDYTAPGKNQYAYMLEGLNEDWVIAGNRRFVSYTHLDPGEYTFRVKGTNSDGVWNEEGITMNFIITPPFWATWWFRTLGVLLIGAIIYALYRYRLNRLLEMERLRTRLAADLHDEIAGNLSSIAMFGKIIHNEFTSGNPKNLAVMQLLERVIQLSQESVGSIRDIIWAIDPKPERLYDLLLRVHDMAAGACRARGITLNFSHPPEEQFPAANLSPRQRKNLWLLMKEAVQNALKHSRASELTIRANYEVHQLQVCISDNGKGFEYTGHFSGKGLQTMRSRAEQLGGALTIASSPNNGTTVTFSGKI